MLVGEHPVAAVTQGSTRQEASHRPGAEPSLLQPGLDLSKEESRFEALLHLPWTWSWLAWTVKMHETSSVP